jgi:hypothetical protein
MEFRLGHDVLCGGCPSFLVLGQPLLRRLGLLRTHDFRRGRGMRSRLEVGGALATCLSLATMTGYDLLLWDLWPHLSWVICVLCCVYVVGLAFRGVLRDVWLPFLYIICSLLVNESR